MELSVAIQAKVEVTPSIWNFGFQPTPVKWQIVILPCHLILF